MDLDDILNDVMGEPEVKVIHYDTYRKAYFNLMDTY